MNYVLIEALTQNGYKPLFKIFKTKEEYIIHDYYLHTIHCVISALDIFPILDNAPLKTEDKPDIATAIFKL